MVNELKIQMDKFIDSCNNQLLIDEARYILSPKVWWCNALKNSDHSMYFIRTEEIFKQHREKKITPAK